MKNSDYSCNIIRYSRSVQKCALPVYKYTYEYCKVTILQEVVHSTEICAYI